jgi:hypothetical protein
MVIGEHTEQYAINLVVLGVYHTTQPQVPIANMHCAVRFDKAFYNDGKQRVPNLTPFCRLPSVCNFVPSFLVFSSSFTASTDSISA